MNQPNHGPLRKAFSQQELITEARRFIYKNDADLKKENPDRFYERLGLLVDFVTTIVPEK